MTRNINREEAMRIAAEQVRRKKEREEREDREFYERITSGKLWLAFRAVVVFCTLMAVVTTFETFVDGRTEKLTEKDWKIDRDWEWTWHKVLDVKGYMFSPELKNWHSRVESSLAITYSPIFHTGKKLVFDIEVDKSTTLKHEEIRQRSIFTWFPFLQLFLLIPLITLIFKRQSPWFNFARVFSFVFVFPGMLLLLFFTMM